MVCTMIKAASLCIASNFKKVISVLKLSINTSLESSPVQYSPSFIESLRNVTGHTCVDLVTLTISYV